MSSHGLAQNQSSLKKNVLQFNSISLSSQHQYGLWPVLNDSVYPNWVYNSKMEMKGKVFGLPVVTEYFFLSSPGQLNIPNGFHFSVDYTALKRMKTLDRFDTGALVDRALDSIARLESLYNRRLDYLNRLQPDAKIPQWSIPEFPSTANYPNDSLPDRALISDSIAVSADISDYKNKLEALSDAKRLWLSRKEALNTLSPEQALDTLYRNKAARVEKFNLGVFGADISPFLIQSVVLRGGQFAMKKGNWRGEIALGRTINYQLTENNVPSFQNRVKEWRNILMDNGRESSRAIFATQVGKGDKDSSHVYVGALIGQGKKHLFSSNSPSARNIVGEIEYQFVSKESKIKVNAAQSFLRSYDFTASDLQTTANREEERGSALSLTYDQKWKKSGLVLATKAMYFSPLFSSFGIGVGRRDCVRGEIKVSKSFKTLGKWSIQYKRDQTNLSKALPSSVLAENYKLTWSIKPIKRAQVNLTYLWNETSTQGDFGSSSFVMNMINVVSSYQFKWKKITPLATVVYNLSTLENDSTSYQLSTANANLSWMVGKKTAINTGLVYASGMDSVMHTIHNYFLTSSIQFSTKKASISVGLTGGKSHETWTIGASMQAGLAFGNGWQLNIIGERVLHDETWMMGFDEAAYRQFPYRFSGGLTYTWTNSK